MCTEAQRKRIQAYVHEGREDKDQAYVHKNGEDKDQAYVQNREGASLFAQRNKG